MPYYHYMPINREIDLRSEFTNLINGSASYSSQIPHGQWLILRKLKRDDSGNAIKSNVVDPVTGEPDMVFRTDNMTDTGYLYDDHQVKGYLTIVGLRISGMMETQTEPGVLNSNPRVLYLDYQVKPEVHDLVYELKLDDAGEIISPITKVNTWYITAVKTMVSDNSRIEFYTCLLEEQR